MALSLVTPPEIEPVPYQELQSHLRVTTDREKGLIVDLGVAAREYVEHQTHRALNTQTWDWSLDRFPCGDVFALPKAPLISVTSITYYDTALVLQTWSSSYYTVNAPAGPHCSPGTIALVSGQVYPATRSAPDSVIVRFIAGYGKGESDVPFMLRNAIKLMVGHWFNAGRELVAPDRTLAQVPVTIDAMIWPFKAFS